MCREASPYLSPSRRHQALCLVGIAIDVEDDPNKDILIPAPERVRQSMLSAYAEEYVDPPSHILDPYTFRQFYRVSFYGLTQSDLGNSEINSMHSPETLLDYSDW